MSSLFSLSSFCPLSVLFLSSLCPLSVLSLSSFCPLSVLSLSSLCPLSVLFLSSFFPLSVLSLSSLCPLSVLSLSSFFPLSVLSLSSFCPLSVLSLSSFCPLSVLFVLSLSSLCPLSVLSLSSFCPLSVLCLSSLSSVCPLSVLCLSSGCPLSVLCLSSLSSVCPLSVLFVLCLEQTVSVVQNYTYDDGCEPCGTDTFSREPFVVMFSSNYPAVRTFVLVPQHTSPDSAVEEVDALYDVVKDVRQRHCASGDFNTGCNYVSGSDWDRIRLFTDQSFHWLISNEADTTVSHTECAYDRIVVTADMLKGVEPGSAQVYNYMTDLKLSHQLVPTPLTL
uniref:Deoxyribonuclease I n=1 Tax=Sphaeramia orbicularis TaxID=375764 RepID=A0A672ZC67_9TELE